MNIFSIDPGPTESAFVHAVDGRVLSHAKLKNDELLTSLYSWPYSSILAVEAIQSFGMSVGAEVFTTCFWCGRFVEAWDASRETDNWTLVYRREVKLYLCGSMRAKDGNIRQAIIDRFGGKDRAIGKKKTPGPLHGLAGDEWSALAVALTVEGRSDGNE